MYPASFLYCNFFASIKGRCLQELSVPELRGYLSQIKFTKISKFFVYNAEKHIIIIPREKTGVQSGYI